MPVVLRVSLLLCLLSACAPRAALNMVPQSVVAGPPVGVFFATTRGEDKDTVFGIDRSTLRYGRVDVAIPENHVTGKIELGAQSADAANVFVATARDSFADEAQYRNALARAIHKLPPAEREAVIYVHGFNINFAEGVFRIAQLHRDFGITGVPVLYSWPSRAHPFGYAYDRDSVLFARDGLEALIRDVRAAGATNILLVGHSMGAQLVMESLRQMAIQSPDAPRRYVDAVVLISPDIDVDVFRSQAKRMARLPQPFVIFVSRRDRVLALAARVGGEQHRLGNVSSVQAMADLPLTIVDVTDFSKGGELGHFTVARSPALIQILSQIPSIDAVIRGDTAGRTGLLAGTVLAVQEATEIVLSPISALGQ